jgi:hypothetical protein
MTVHPIIPKIAYIPLEYTLSVDEFTEMWDLMEELGEPTQKDYDTFLRSYAEQYFYDMRSDIEDSIRLKRTID